VGNRKCFVVGKRARGRRGHSSSKKNTTRGRGNKEKRENALNYLKERKRNQEEAEN